MKNRLSIDYQALRETYLVANTPGYLLREFLDNPSIQEARKVLTTSDIEIRCNKLNKTRIKSIDDEIELYALLTILSRKTLNPKLARLWDKLSTSPFGWVSDIARIVLDNQMTTQTTLISQKNQAVVFKGSRASKGSTIQKAMSISPRVKQE